LGAPPTRQGPPGRLKCREAFRGRAVSRRSSKDTSTRCTRGVPTGQVRYDNLTPAVKKGVFRSRSREENPRWTSFHEYYGFTPFYCEPGLRGAHEKGGVEGQDADDGPGLRPRGRSPAAAAGRSVRNRHHPHAPRRPLRHDHRENVPVHGPAPLHRPQGHRDAHLRRPDRLRRPPGDRPPSAADRPRRRTPRPGPLPGSPADQAGSTGTLRGPPPPPQPW
jgi:hypothetical protein